MKSCVSIGWLLPLLTLTTYANAQSISNANSSAGHPGAIRSQFQNVLPVCDLIAWVKHDDKGYHLVGSFRLMQKPDFDLSHEKPSFFVSSHDPREDYIPNDPMNSGFDIYDQHGSWKRIPFQPNEVYVTIPSDYKTTPRTAAEIEFDILLRSTKPHFRAKTTTEISIPVALAVAMDGDFIDDSDIPTISRHEISFAMCSLPPVGQMPRGEAGLDTNSILPVGIAPSDSKFQIGADDDSVYTFGKFLTWIGHYNFDSTPAIFSVNVPFWAGPTSYSNWFDLNWTRCTDPTLMYFDFSSPLKQGPVGTLIFQDVRRPKPTYGQRNVDVGSRKFNEWQMIYSADIIDVRAKKFFQIGGVIHY